MKLYCLAIVFLVRIAIAAEVSVTMTADKTSLSLEDQIEIQVSVQGTRQGANPQLLNAENFDVQSTGTSSQVQIINGQVSKQTVFGFVLSPKQSGSFRIGPARVNVGDKVYDSAPIDITVVKQTPSTATSERFFYVTAEIDNKTPFVNEQISYTFKFYNRARLANAQLGLPDFKGFLKEGPDKEQQAEEVIGGVRWQVTTLRFALFPMSAGELTIEPAKIIADAVIQERRDRFFDDFFASRTKRVNVRSEPIHVMVNPVPTDQRPASFSGLVGQINLSAQLGKQALTVGDSSTLTLRLEGNGNLRDFSLAETKSPDFKIYDDQPTFSIQPAAKLWKGVKTFKRALVPLKPGTLTVEPIHLAYFDTATKTYKTLETQKLVFTVSGSAADDTLTHVVPSAQTSTKKQIQLLAKSLMPIKRTPSAIRTDKLRSQEKMILLVICLLCPVLYIILLVVKTRRDRLLSDVGLMRRRKAFRDFRLCLKKVKADGAFVKDASLLFREYLGNKFDLDGKAITAIDAERKLAFRLSKDVISKIEYFLRECDAGLYGGEELSREANTRHHQALVSLVQDIEKEAPQ